MGFSLRAVLAAVSIASVVTACGSGPSKREAMDAVGRDTTTDASCTLPIDIIHALRVQHTTKGMCLPKDDPGRDKIKACMDALVAAHVTQLKPASYMREWPDDVAARSLSDVPAYERKSRDLLFTTCWELGDTKLRQGQFVCAKTTNDKLVDVTKIDEAHADVKIAQKITPSDDLAAIDAACGGRVSKPPNDITYRIEKTSKGWALAPTDPTAPIVGH